MENLVKTGSIFVEPLALSVVGLKKHDFFAG
jgi:hypothetical protein